MIEGQEVVVSKVFTPTIFLLSLFRSLPTGFFIPCFYPQNLKHLQQYHHPDREQTENGKISIFRCVLHRSSQNSLFGQVAGPFQEIISQPHREKHVTETHRKITPQSGMRTYRLQRQQKRTIEQKKMFT